MRILVVDDELAIIHRLQTILVSEGHQIWACLLNSQEAVDRVVSLATFMEFDVALLDLLMPQVTGDILAARLREVAPSMRLVLLTRNSMGQVFRDRRVVDEILMEPFEREDLLKALAPEL